VGRGGVEGDCLGVDAGEARPFAGSATVMVRRPSGSYVRRRVDRPAASFRQRRRLYSAGMGGDLAGCPSGDAPLPRAPTTRRRLRHWPTGLRCSRMAHHPRHPRRCHRPSPLALHRPSWLETLLAGRLDDDRLTLTVAPPSPWGRPWQRSSFAVHPPPMPSALYRHSPGIPATCCQATVADITLHAPGSRSASTAPSHHRRDPPPPSAELGLPTGHTPCGRGQVHRHHHLPGLILGAP